MAGKEKKHGFFADTEDPENETEILSVNTTETEKEKKHGNRTAIRALILVTAALVTVWLGIKYLSGSDEVKGSAYSPISGAKTENKKPFLDIYDPDYETDITTIPGYMELSRDIKYSPDGMQYIGTLPEDYYQLGGNGLVFMADYIEALIRGDSEAVNGMFNEEYYEENEPLGKITPQKLFDISITKYLYHDKKYDDTAYDDLYYIVSYSIYHNDATFRDDIDEHCSLPQLFELLVYPDKTIKIKRVTDLPGFNGYNN